MKNILPNMHFETCKVCLCATCLYRKDGICIFKNINIDMCKMCKECLKDIERIPTRFCFDYKEDEEN